MSILGGGLSGKDDNDYNDGQTKTNKHKNNISVIFLGHTWDISEIYQAIYWSYLGTRFVPDMTGFVLNMT